MTKQEEINTLAEEIAVAYKEGAQIHMKETKAYIEQHRTYNSKSDYDKAHTKTIAQIVAKHLISIGYHRDIEDDYYEEPDAHSCREHMNAEGFCTWCGAIVHGTSADYSIHGYDPPDSY